MKAFAVGLLHDVLEDTETTKDYIVQEFGENVAHLIKVLLKSPFLRIKAMKLNKLQIFGRLFWPQLKMSE